VPIVDWHLFFPPGSHSFNVRLTTTKSPTPQEFFHEEYQVSQMRFSFARQLTVM
jgi:hypothetical protein